MQLIGEAEGGLGQQLPQGFSEETDLQFSKVKKNLKLKVKIFKATSIFMCLELKSVFDLNINIFIHIYDSNNSTGFHESR